MLSSDAFQRALNQDASAISKSHQPPREASPAETPLTRTRSVHSDLARPDLPNPLNQANDIQTITNAESGVSNVKPSAADSKEREIVRLQHLLADLRTAHKAKEVVLRSTRTELKDARDTLTTTFSEYCSLRDEMRMIKQKITTEHQAIVYRKDIELFALRKGIEQKDRYIKDHDAKLDEVYHQQRATVELKNAQLKMLKERLAAVDRQRSPRFSHEHKQSEEGDHALEVRMLRIRKGRASKSVESLEATRSEPDNEKDATIVSLREQLAVAKKTAGEVVNQQAELQRAWDVVKKSQASLKAERELHAQTKEQLQELTVKLEEGEQQQSRPNSIGRLPTIEEDKDELEAIFDTTQEDNLRLYAEIEALEKRLRDANARMFAAEQIAEQLRVQAQQEKPISDDSESARPSVVHHVHFQRLETQLKENRDALAVKEHEVGLLKKTLSDKIDVMANLHAELNAAITFHTQDQDEIERLKNIITELQTTKQQLMHDHERLAIQRTRLRISSADRNSARNSARSSGATLTQEQSPQLTGPSGEAEPIEALPAMPAPLVDERMGSTMQETKKHTRSQSSPTLLSNEMPPMELRGLKRRSWGVRAYVKKMVGKDSQSEKASGPAQGTDTMEGVVRGSAALATKDRNALLRPSTAAPAKLVTPDPFITSATSVPVPQNVRPGNKRRHTPRYYASPLEDQKAEAKEGERPRTAAGDMKSKDDTARPSSRKSWGATNKLKRRSMF
ncbi:hypothetical protein CC86DRAFT_433285 [Ophiobolus disseminans]|uniref:Uncharacterized protein n=1 Tax=Ophiobolus disseminans TaxID=1469910 RepID=A0A6A6ZDY2_9PLEO|nr:hypothetical protein CC86DRAFT_433285 [Ophiobolus disseminans]